MRQNYWSCTKFADVLRGTPKIKAGTSKQWKDWEKSARQKPIRYWPAEEGLDYLQNFVNWPNDQLKEIRHYINNRWISKTHGLTSSLKRGRWYEFETRLLHSAFDALIDFVEIEVAAREYACIEKKERKQYPLPFYRHFLPIYTWRSSNAGLSRLKWAAELKYDESWINKEDPYFGQFTPQALAAQETIKLYTWWKHERPKRPDPMDTSGLTEYYETKDAHSQDSWKDFEDRSAKEIEAYRKLSTLCHQIEQEQEDEDTEMLVRLVKLRTHVWT